MADLEHQIVELIPRLRRYARALHRGDVAAADDLVQDCLERALGRMARWRRGSDLRAWLFTIMHNVHVNQLRRHHAGPAFVAITDERTMAVATPPSDHGLALRDLERAIDTLPPEQREVLLLVTLENLKYRQVAVILGIPEGTVMSRLSRAREQLRRIMGEDRRSPLRSIV